MDALDPRDVLDFRVTGRTKVAGVFKVVQKEGQQAASSYTAASIEWQVKYNSIQLINMYTRKRLTFTVKMNSYSAVEISL